MLSILGCTKMGGQEHSFSDEEEEEGEEKGAEGEGEK